MQWKVSQVSYFENTFETDTAEDAARMYVERYHVFDNGIRFVKVADVEYKVTITRGVVDGVDEVQA